MTNNDPRETINRFVKINIRGGEHDERKLGFSSLKKFFIFAFSVQTE